VHHDAELADEVIAFDDEVDRRYFAVEEGIESLLARPLAEAAATGMTDRSARDALAVITAAYEYFGNFRLRTLRSA
jgi:phosphate uptake regulator